MNDNKYQNGKIYRLICNTTRLEYYGSTCQKRLCSRLAHHKAGYKKYLNGKSGFITSYKIFENDNYEIILVEFFPCNSKDELHQRERFYIENNDCVNKVIPTRTHKEYMEQYCKNKIKIANKKWYEKNKNERKMFRIENKEYIKEINKRYYEKNKNKIRERQKKYYEDKKNN